MPISPPSQTHHLPPVELQNSLDQTSIVPASPFARDTLVFGNQKKGNIASQVLNQVTEVFWKVFACVVQLFRYVKDGITGFFKERQVNIQITQDETEEKEITFQIEKGENFNRAYFLIDGKKDSDRENYISYRVAGQVVQISSVVIDNPVVKAKISAMLDYILEEEGKGIFEANDLRHVSYLYKVDYKTVASFIYPMDEPTLDQIHLLNIYGLIELLKASDLKPPAQEALDRITQSIAQAKANDPTEATCDLFVSDLIALLEGSDATPAIRGIILNYTFGDALFRKD